jgi:hypothetical protein
VVCICHVRKKQSTGKLTCPWLGGLGLSLISGPDSLLTMVRAACNGRVGCRCPNHAPSR